MVITAVIPAFNEESTIGGVVQAVRLLPEVQQVVVVDDGSEDQTAQQARTAGAVVVELEENQGKAAAVTIGFEHTNADVILFLDADLVGLTDEHVRALLRPVVAGHCDMTIGVFDQGRVATDLAQVVAPYLSGQRAVRRAVLDEMLRTESKVDVSRFGIEVALTRHVRRYGYRVAEVPLQELTHRMKEEKLGLVKGFAARMKMYSDILKYALKG